MNADQIDFKYKDLTEKIIGVFYEVYNKLEYGFLEKVYENAMMIELRRAGIDAKAQMPVTVMYDEETVGEYSADILRDWAIAKFRAKIGNQNKGL